MYIVTAVLTVVLLLSANSTNSSLALLTYAFLPIGLFMPEVLLPAYFIASLSSNFFMAAQGVGFGRLLALVIIAGVMLRKIGRREPLLAKWIVNCTFIAYATSASFLSGYGSNLSPIYIMGLNLLVLIAMANLSLNSEELLELFRAILFAVLITIVFYVVSFIQNPQILPNGRLTLFEGINENRFAMMMGQMSAFCLAYMIFSNKIFTKVICLCGGAITAYFVLMSGSRSALIGLVVGFLLAALISMNIQNKLKKHFFSLLITCTVAVFIFYSIIEINPVLLKRMNIGELVSSGGTHRWPRIVAEFQYIIPSHPFFGVGLGSDNETIALAQYMDDPGSSHNFLSSSLTQVGVVGFIAYMSFYWKIIKETISQLRSKEVLIIPLMLIMTLVFNGIGEVIFSERIFWNNLSLAALCLATYSTENRINARKLSDSKFFEITERPNT